MSEKIQRYDILVYGDDLYESVESEDGYYMLSEDVDAVIASKDKEIAELKAQLGSEKAGRHADSVNVDVRESRLRKALYKACANWALHAQWEKGPLVETWKKWEQVERKCRTMAEHCGEDK